MKPEADLEEGEIRLLEVDNPVLLPLNTHVRVIVTSTDVLHDFALPAAGVKIDAAPGRLNRYVALSPAKEEKESQGRGEDFRLPDGNIVHVCGSN